MRLSTGGLHVLLIARAERELAQRGMVRRQLQLGVGNERARIFYERRGFQRRADYDLLDKSCNSTPFGEIGGL